MGRIVSAAVAGLFVGEDLACYDSDGLVAGWAGLLVGAGVWWGLAGAVADLVEAGRLFGHGLEELEQAFDSSRVDDGDEILSRGKEVKEGTIERSRLANHSLRQQLAYA